MIEILQTKEKSDSMQCYVTFKELEDYGAAVVQYLNEKKGEKALLILSRAHTTNISKIKESASDKLLSSLCVYIT